MTPLRRYHRFLLILVLGTLIAGFALNTWVNPWRVTPKPWSSDAFKPYRAIPEDRTRTAKSGLVRSGGWEAAMFGSSRVDIALDPTHPLFEGTPCANLGLNAGYLTENHRLFRYFMDHHDPELVIFTLDPGDLTTPMPEHNPTDYALSPLAEDADPIERELSYHLGISATTTSFQTIWRRLRDRPADHTPRGFRRDAAFPADLRPLVAGLYLATTSRIATTRSDYNRLAPEKAALLREIVERCAEEDTRLVFLLTPNHALFQLSFDELGVPDPWFGRDRRFLAGLASDHVEVWDFLDGHPLNAEPLPPAETPGARFENWIDLFHATPALGDLMLDRIGGAAGDYGVRLTPENVEARIEEVEREMERFVRDHPEDVAFLREGLKAYRKDS